jgi:predicted peptidase
MFKSLQVLLSIFMFNSLTLAAEPTALYEERSVTISVDGKDETFKYRLMKPAKVEPGKKYPLVLFLHGAGERGDDNKSQLKYGPTWLADDKNREKYPCYVLAPQCRNGKKWAEVDWSAATSTPLAAEPGSQMKYALAAFDDTIKKEQVDESRLYLTGISMGGYGSWDLAARLPDRFAAVVPICGGGDEKQAPKLTKLPIWVWHGDADKAVKVERSRQMVEAIKKAGGSPKYSELPGVGHDSWTAAYTGPDNCLSWLFEQKKK